MLLVGGVSGRWFCSEGERRGCLGMGRIAVVGMGCWGSLLALGVSCCCDGGGD